MDASELEIDVVGTTSLQQEIETMGGNRVPQLSERELMTLLRWAESRINQGGVITDIAQQAIEASVKMGTEQVDAASTSLLTVISSLIQNDATSDAALSSFVLLIHSLLSFLNQNGELSDESPAGRYHLLCLEGLTFLVQNANASAETLSGIAGSISALYKSAPHLSEILAELTGYIKQSASSADATPALREALPMFDNLLQGLDSGDITEPPAKRQKLDHPRFDLGLPDDRLLTRAELNAVIVDSIREIDASSEAIQQLHLKGLEENIIQEARKLQWAELQVLLAEKAKKEVLSVDVQGEVDAEQLLKQAETQDYAFRQGREVLSTLKTSKDSKVDSSELVKEAFNCITSTVAGLEAEGKFVFKQGAALVSRLVVQHGNDDTRTSVIQSCMATEDFNINFALQLLYSHYAALAPFELMDNPSLLHATFEPLAPSPDCTLNPLDPLYWVKPGAIKHESPFAFDEGHKPGKLNKYTEFFLQLFDNLKDRVMMEVEPKKTILSELLLKCPALPREIWELVNNVFCTSGDRLKTWTGLKVITELLEKRPAMRQRALSYMLHYATGACEMVRTGAINFLVYRLMQSDPQIERITVKYVKDVIHHAMEMGQDAPKGSIETLLNNCLTLFYTLCVMHEPLLSYMFEVVLECKEKSRQQRVILGHPGLEKLVSKIGAKKLLAVVSTLPLCNLSLHIIRLLIHQAKEELAGETVMGVREEIEKELFEIKKTATGIYEREKDMRYMILLMSLTPKETIKMTILPEVLMKCREEHVNIALKEAITPLTHHYHKGLGMSPVEMLLYLHTLKPATDGSGPTLRNIVVAIDKCLINLRHIFNEQEVATVLQQLVTVDPPPQVLMRTILQTVYSHPTLLSFILTSLMPVLFAKKIWEAEDQILWKGFTKLALDHQPKTLDTLLLLPEKVLLDMLSNNTQLLRHFVRYLNQNKLVHSKMLATLEGAFAGISHIV